MVCPLERVVVSGDLAPARVLVEFATVADRTILAWCVDVFTGVGTVIDARRRRERGMATANLYAISP